MRETPSRSIRSPAVAGSFYPQDPRHLADTVDTLLADAQGASRAPARQPYAIVVPHAGYVYSGIVAAAAYRTLAHYRTRFRRVLLIGPAHRVAFEGIAAPSAAFFRTPLGDIPLDTEAISALCSLSGISIRDDAHAQEHSLEVQLPFLQRTLGNFHVIPLIVGSAAPARVEEVISIMTSVPGTLVVISSDLSHYLDYESAEHLDSETVDAILRLDVGGIADRGACGRLPIKGLLGVAHATGLEATLLDRRNSGDTAGPKDRVVGYASMGFYRATGDGLQSTAGEVLLHIADRALRHGLATGKPLPLNPEGYSHELSQPGASFVTLKQATDCAAASAP
jgi:MEMO1 family protein